MRDTKSEVMSIRIEEETAANLRALSKRDDVPVSWLIRRFLREGIKRLLSKRNGK